LLLPAAERRGMVMAALVLGAGLGVSGASGVGADVVLRVNMEGPRGSVAGTLGG